MKMMAIGMSKEFGTSTLAGSESEHARIPMVLPNDREAVDAAIATIGPVDSDSLRLVHITNTKDLATLEVSTALLAECAERDDLTVIGEPFPLSYMDDRLTSLLRRPDAQPERKLVQGAGWRR